MSKKNDIAKKLLEKALLDAGIPEDVVKKQKDQLLKNMQNVATTLSITGKNRTSISSVYEPIDNSQIAIADGLMSANALSQQELTSVEQEMEEIKVFRTKISESQRQLDKVENFLKIMLLIYPSLSKGKKVWNSEDHALFDEALVAVNNALSLSTDGDLPAKEKERLAALQSFRDVVLFKSGLYYNKDIDGYTLVNLPQGWNLITLLAAVYSKGKLPMTSWVYEEDALSSFRAQLCTNVVLLSPESHGAPHSPMISVDSLRDGRLDSDIRPDAIDIKNQKAWEIAVKVAGCQVAFFDMDRTTKRIFTGGNNPLYLHIVKSKGVFYILAKSNVKQGTFAVDPMFKQPIGIYS